MLKLQQVLMDHFFQMTSQQVQSLSPEDQQSPQTSWKWIKRMGFLISRMANLIRAESTKELKFKEPLPHSDPRCDIKAGQQALLSWQPDQPGSRLGGFEAAFVSQVLSRRGIGIYDLYCTSFQSYEAYQRDKYHKEENPMGYINLGTSENKLCLDLIKERGGGPWTSHKLSQCDMNQTEDDLLQYSDWQGHSFLRKELASFLTCYCRAPTPLDPENVVVLNGCSSVFSSLAMVLCDPGDAFLIPTPCYNGFAFSSCLYSKVELIPVYLESQADSSFPQLTMDMLELTLTQAKMKVKGLVLVNPQNPLGEVYTRSMLKEYLVFAKKHNLHVVIDEIYMLSVFDASITFHSVLNIKHLPDPNKTHMIWGTSKDFGISGFRFGVLYTHNKEVASAMRAFGYLHGVSGITQFKLCQLLQDRGDNGISPPCGMPCLQATIRYSKRASQWTMKRPTVPSRVLYERTVRRMIDQLYLPTNHSRLRRAYLYVTKRLEKLKVPFFNGGSGLYVWINLRAYLSPCTFEQEQILCQCFQDNKLLLSRGRSYMCKEPGWFRLVFAEDQLQLKVAMDWFCQVLKEHKKDRRLKQLEPAIAK